jgi:hypothetical protein
VRHVAPVEPSPTWPWRSTQRQSPLLLDARGGARRFERADDAFYDHLHSEGLLDLPQQWLQAAKGA